MASPVLTSAGLRPAATLFRSLADRTRLAILSRLAQGEARVVDLTQEFGLPQSTVSTHLTCLRDCDLIRGRTEGRQVFYTLRHPELLDLLRAARALLEATGEAVLMCPNYGQESLEQVPARPGR